VLNDTESIHKPQESIDNNTNISLEQQIIDIKKQIVVLEGNKDPDAKKVFYLKRDISAIKKQIIAIEKAETAIFRALKFQFDTI
jgi:hypothetical protein